MKKTNITKQLLGPTSGQRLGKIALGTSLSFLVYLGALFTTDAAIYLVTANTAFATRCGACHYDGPPPGGDHGGPVGPGNDPYNPGGQGGNDPYGGNGPDYGGLGGPVTPDLGDPYEYGPGGRDPLPDYDENGTCTDCVDPWNDYFGGAGEGGGGGGTPPPSDGTGTTEGQDASIGDSWNCLSVTGC